MAQVLVTRDDRGPVTVLTLDREDRLNAMSEEMKAQLLAHLSDLAADKAVRACVLTGRGIRAFTSGADISMPETHATPAPTSLARLQSGWHWLTPILEFPKPMVCAVNGYAIGAGFVVALCCDSIVVGENAKFKMPNVPIGIMPAYASTARLAQWVGRGRAIDIIFSGRFVEAAEAERIGLASSIHPVDELVDAAVEHARRYVNSPPLTVKLAKESMLMAMEGGAMAQTAIADGYRTILLHQTQDTLEAHVAWRERREPTYRYQ